MPTHSSIGPTASPHAYFHEERSSPDVPFVLAPRTLGTAVSKALHTHPEGQFYFATHGLMVVETALGRCVMPPGRMGWIPPMVPHGATVIGSRQPERLDKPVGATLHLRPALCAGLPTEPAVLGMNDVSRALLARMLAWDLQAPLSPSRQRLMAVFLDELQAAKPEPFRLRMPQSARLATMAAAIAQDPADPTSLDAWEQKLHMSRRSITRHFREETGMSLVEWRQVARLQRALELLGEGASVTSVSLTLGYESVSSFIALFRRLLGTTPAQAAATMRTG